MFAYRHAFHAGNHADVMKHAVLVLTLELLQKKESSLLVIDTHAGAGLYALASPLVRGKGEWPTGIGRLWDNNDLPEELASYMGIVKKFNKSKKLTHYPGSALIASQMLRHEDRLRAFEMHPSDIGPLQSALKGHPRQIKAERKDGFAQLRALLPPSTKRALVLIDPPYELREDYQRTIVALKEGLARFATGTYLVWIPQVARYQVERMVRQIGALGVTNRLLLTLRVRAPLSDGLGLTGSSLAILNPPFGLEEKLRRLLPALATLLGEGPKAHADVTTAFGSRGPNAVFPAKGREGPPGSGPRVRPVRRAR